MRRLFAGAMTDSERRQRCLVVIFLILLSAKVHAQTHPVLFKTSARETIWAQMKTDYEQNPTTPATYGGKWYKYIRASALNQDGPGWANTFMYHVTGDTSYATRAWGLIVNDYFARPDTDGGVCRDYGRDRMETSVWQYDWLYPALTQPQRDQFLAKLNTTANVCLIALPQGAWDDDETVAFYMGMAMLYAATSSYNASVVTYWNDAARQIGGWDATAQDKATRRNALKLFLYLSGGGEFFDSSQYTLNTSSYILFGYAAIEPVSPGHFPEVAAWIPGVAERMMHGMSPDLRQPYQFGDSETPRTPRMFYRSQLVFMADGLANEAGASVGPRIHDWTLDLIDQLGGFASGPNGDEFGSTGINPTTRSFLWNPYATRGDHTTTPLTYDATGLGITSSRTGWDNNAAWFSTRFMPVPEAIYGEAYLSGHAGFKAYGEWQLWKNGHWLITHPISYDGPGTDARGSNLVTIGGWPNFPYYLREYVGRPTYNDTSNFFYISATAGGNVIQNGEWLAPSTFIMEYGRSTVWLKNEDVVIVYDRINSLDPRPCYVGWKTAQHTWCASRPNAKELHINSPVNPTLTSGKEEWTNANGDNVRVVNLLPTSIVRTVENQATLWASPGYYWPGYWNASEAGYQTIVSPSATNQWDVFLNVWGVAGPTISLVQDTSAKVDATLVIANGRNYLVAFNAIPGPDLPNHECDAGGYCSYSGTAHRAAVAAILDHVRLRHTSYQLAFNDGGQTTDLILADLDVGYEWTYRINGGAPVNLTVASSGLAAATIESVGPVTLDVISGGAMPVSIVEGTLPSGRTGAAYSQSLTAVGGNGGPYTWSKTVGSFPTGLSMTTNVISGTPSVVETQEFTIRACDSTPSCDSRVLSIQISGVPLLSGSYDNGTVNTAYSDGITVTGGQAPYTYAKTSGTICSGLSIAADTGIISGVPTTVQTCSFEVTVTDNASVTDTKGFQISIGNAPELPALRVRAEPSDNGVVVHMSTHGLQNTDTCTVDILEGNASVVGNVTTAGRALRTISFTGLLESKLYGIDATCGQIIAARSYFFTQPRPIDIVTVSYVFYFKPAALLSSQGAAKISAVAESESGGPDVVKTSTACDPSCNLTLDLVNGDRYSIFYSWENAAENQVASNKVGLLVAVP